MKRGNHPEVTEKMCDRRVFLVINDLREELQFTFSDARPALPCLRSK
jgi:hypothetical protein